MCLTYYPFNCVLCEVRAEFCILITLKCGREENILAKNGVTGNWKRLHNEELHDLYFSSNIIRMVKKNEMGGTCGIYGGEERCMQVFFGETCGKETIWNTLA